jgi:hypothetical protein
MRIFLACTPRTGNLWIRRVLAHALGVPQIATHTPQDIDWSGLPTDCMVAMHWHRSQAFADHLRQSGFKVIITARHPLDVLISILRFATVEPATARWLNGECGDESRLIGATPDSPEFAAYCLGDRAAALLSISQQWRSDAEATIRYEDFRQSPASVAQRVLAVLGADPATDVSEAIQANSMEKLRPISSRHLWRGRSGDWRRVVGADLAGQIARRHQSYCDDFGYACDPDPLLDAATARHNWEEMLAESSPAP